MVDALANSFLVAFGTLVSGIIAGFGFPVPFVVATVGGAVGLALVYTQVGGRRARRPSATDGKVNDFYLAFPNSGQ